jgi:hypothetical protein
MIHLAAVRACEMDVRERVRNAQETYAFFKTVTSYLRQEPTGLKYEGYQMLDEGLLTYRNRLYIPNCDDLKRFIMDELHKRPYTGHLGYQKMIMTTRKQFYWHGLKKDIVDYLAKCLECHQVKAEHRVPNRVVTTPTHPRMEMGNHLHGFHHRITKIDQEK